MDSAFPVFGMLIAQGQAVTVVMPVWEGRISPVLDVAGRFLVVQVEKNRETSRREILVAETSPALLAKGIKEMGAEILVCGALSQPVAFSLEKAGVRIQPHICGETDAVLKAFLSGALERAEFRMPGCCQQHCGWHRNRYRHRGHRWQNLKEQSIQSK